MEHLGGPCLTDRWSGVDPGPGSHAFVGGGPGHALYVGGHHQLHQEDRGKHGEQGRQDDLDGDAPLFGAQIPRVVVTKPAALVSIAVS